MRWSRAASARVARIFAAAAERGGDRRRSTSMRPTSSSPNAASARSGRIFRSASARRRRHILPLLADGKVVVIPGYIGSGPDGELVTLGRGGSDFSAAHRRAQRRRARVDALQGSRRPDDRRSEERSRCARHRRAALPRSRGARVLRREGAASAHDDSARRARDPAVRAQHVFARPAPERASPAT